MACGTSIAEARGMSSVSSCGGGWLWGELDWKWYGRLCEVDGEGDASVLVGLILARIELT
eukprot:CAMPEP_0174701496 /NCGR_PEP_ID=MMETSP1094-20130205/6113_1 /TAXON_ID=156173 /ORGANISM="Chrysochromulina brevifilum, Strain UTEX LB 985" /LENGTH=59 /DNA_ID=CAMNT_0015899147 /DNA_START=55 /DNA_END=234 /DNA_ORIENTATION=+